MSSIKKPTKTKTMMNAKGASIKNPKAMPSKKSVKPQPKAAKIPATPKMKMGGMKKGK